MKKMVFALGLLLLASPAFAQFGGLNRVLDKAQKVKRLADIKISDTEERQIGQQVSDRIVSEFGVLQDTEVTKYVTLVGSVMAQASPRPDFEWQFIVLDTDGVNAFAAPGGFVHVTKGLLGLMKNEAELAGVLGHEITHITEKHTVNSIQRNDVVKFTSDEVSTSGGLTQALMRRLAEQVYMSVLDNDFSRGDEHESDADGVVLANKVGYAPTGLSSVLTKLAERNKDRQEPNGLFASHPSITDRLANVARVIREKNLKATALVEARYAKYVAFEARPVGELPLVDPAVRGLSGGDDKGDKKEGEKEKEKQGEEKKSGGGLLGRMKLSGGSQSQNSQTVASAGARGVRPDRDAVGGPNKTKVPITVAPTEISEFRTGIA